MQKIILAGGCYWCVEAIFKLIKGCEKIEPGYYKLENNPFSFSEKDKIEVIRLHYNDEILSLEELFNVFFFVHNPTLVSWNKDDSFYPLCRSAILYFTEAQKQKAEEKISQFTLDNIFNGIIQTKVFKAEDINFFHAEEKYTDYYLKNPTDGYCTSIIDPKIQKLKNNFQQLLKK